MNIVKQSVMEISVGDALIQTLAHIAFPPENESRQTKEKMADDLTAALAYRKIDYPKPGVIYGVPYRFESDKENRYIVFTLTKEKVLSAIPELDPTSVTPTVDVIISYVDTSEVDRTRQVSPEAPSEK